MRCEKCYACKDQHRLSETCNYCEHIEGVPFKRSELEQIEYTLCWFREQYVPMIQNKSDAEYVEGFLVSAIKNTMDNENKECLCNLQS